MLTVYMLGSFLIKDQECILNNENIRSDMIIKLLSYIIINRARVLTAEELIEVLWQEDESNNPAGALKNLIYRLRKIFQNQADCDLILFKSGGYGINKEYCIVKLDVDLFDSANTVLMQTHSDFFCLIPLFGRVFTQRTFHSVFLIQSNSNILWLVF